MSILVKRYKKMNKLPFIPENTTILDLSYNKLDKIEKGIPPNVEDINLSNNKITNLPNLSHCTKCHTLNLGYNSLTTIDGNCLPPNLKYLNVFYNNIRNINNIPNTIEYLNIGYNSLKTLIIKNTYKIVEASYNEIFVIKFQEKSILNELYLEYNNLFQVSKLPSSLKKINIHNNFISNLNFLNEGIQHVNIKNNLITLIKNENIPSSINKLILKKNYLESIPFDLEKRDICDVSNTNLNQLKKEKKKKEEEKEPEEELEEVIYE